jgi:protein-L-isoaspartate(D-aspartate) O-methyltransferase
MSDMNLDQARFNMIEQQIRPWDVLDIRVLGLLDEVQREYFVPPRYRNFAYTDMAISLGNGQYMMSPKLEARIVQSVDVKATDKVLEIGTGSGYLTALLAKLAAHVYSIDINPDYTKAAAEKLSSQDIHNVTLETGDGARGWDKYQPYDVIILSGSLPVFDENLQHDLAVGGRLLTIVGESPAMEAVLVTRLGPAEWSRESLFETDIPALINAPQAEKFNF